MNEATSLRFPDPDGRTDRAGRVIPHEFVVLAPDHANLQDADAARRTLWDAVGRGQGTVRGGQESAVAAVSRRTLVGKVARSGGYDFRGARADLAVLSVLAVMRGTNDDNDP